MMTRADRSTGVVLLSLVLMVAGCTSQADDLWAPLRISGDEVESYRTLDQMAEAADVVAVGRFTSVAMGRVWQGDTEQDQVFYAEMTFVPDQHSARNSSFSADSYPVEFLLSAVDHEAAEAAIQTMSNALKDDQVTVFLRQKKAPESRYYRLVNSKGLWIDSDDGVEAPLARETDSAEVSPYASEVSEVDNPSELFEIAAAD